MNKDVRVSNDNIRIVMTENGYTALVQSTADPEIGISVKITKDNEFLIEVDGKNVLIPITTPLTNKIQYKICGPPQKPLGMKDNHNEE